MKEKLRGSGRPTRCLSPAFPGLSFESDLFPSFTSVCLPAKSLQSCPAFWDPRDWSPPGSSLYGILQARILEWVAMLSSRASSQPRDRTHISWGSCIAGRFLSLRHQESPYISYDPAVHFLVFSQERWKLILTSEPFIMFIMFLFIMAQTQKQLTYPLAGEWINKL